VIDTRNARRDRHTPLFNPEPLDTQGRPFLYTQHTRPTARPACASCHSSVTWTTRVDLGNPDATVTTSPIQVLLGAAAGGFSPPNSTAPLTSDFSPIRADYVQTCGPRQHRSRALARRNRSVGYYARADRLDLASATSCRVRWLLGRAQQIDDAE